MTRYTTSTFGGELRATARAMTPDELSTVRLHAPTPRRATDG